ncbi:MAG: TetR/AcrR family transcriptional regulator [Ilumatobacter sp.]|uniref:TetR/AcrR family transcriptional regulator n=1 Tax=Ilumatobacter sp. TaxID=1967498 RepID=UPI002617ACBF|nr:TetR/AcrR family transcriptional regulator [Ilumatobacter sp.]MDJ0767707.1 TetR/AcrR family transcriptional regulator [Ilumatobacter sp.]
MSDAPARPRGRPRTFDEETALDELTALFWRKGYSQTSVADLVESSGVHKPSLYRIFGSKEELFATVLRRYMNTRIEMFGQLVDGVGPGIEGIHTFLSLLRDDVVSGTSRHGCLLVASSTELGGTTPGFEDFGPAYRDAVRRFTRRLVERAGGSEELIAQRTELLVTWMLGLDVTTRGAGDEAEIDRIVDAMHATVDTWSTD